MNQDLITALMIASVGGHLSIVKLLLDARADVHLRNNVCYFYAECGDLDDIISINNLLMSN
jgi:ankyrin repeat protein